MARETRPTHKGDVAVRIYQPKKEVLDGTYKLPPIKKVP